MHFVVFLDNLIMLSAINNCYQFHLTRFIMLKSILLRSFLTISLENAEKSLQILSARLSLSSDCPSREV